MEKIHRSRPEPVLFLMEAADVMREYKKVHGQYASAWCLLEIDFAAGPFRVGQEGTHPTPKDTSHWRPRDCKFTYWIRSESQMNDFWIQAVRDDGVAEYEIRSSMKEPARLTPEGR